MPTARGVRNLLDRALLDHPGPTTRAVQRCVMLCLVNAALTGWTYGRKLWPR
jgi:hypothetical protein